MTLLTTKFFLSKFDHYGRRKNVHKLCSPFLSNRQQYVALNNAKSNKRFINCGVPQGSVLGPLLFMLYINDIFTATNHGPRFYADDTCLTV